MTPSSFEYAVRECDPKPQERELLLNRMAQDGWEPTEVRPSPWWGWSSQDQLTFRRPRA